MVVYYGLIVDVMNKRSNQAKLVGAVVDYNGVFEGHIKYTNEISMLFVF